MLTNEDQGAAPPGETTVVSKMLRVEWLGQTIASICWIASVFVYGISQAGDWLQLAAASAWLVANLASLSSDEAP